MKALDGRNPHSVPHVIEIEAESLAKYETYKEIILCLLIGNKYVPCVSAVSDRYDYVLTAEYKTQRGFDNYMRRFYPEAVAIA